MQSDIDTQGRVRAVAAPLRMQVIQVLREMIATLELKPGQRLVEKDLCDQLGVSRTVVREALRHLEAEQLVEIVPNRGPIVASTSIEEALQIYEAREALESFIARRCAERGRDVHLREMESALKDLSAAHDSSGLVAQLKAKDRLFRAMAEGAGNAVIGPIISALQIRVRLIDGLPMYTFGQHRDTLTELESIVKAIQSGDADRASDLAVQYVRSGQSVVEHFAGPLSSDTEHKA